MKSQAGTPRGTGSPDVASTEGVLEAYRREVDPAEYRQIRALYKAHSIAEDARDLPGLLATLTPDCVYELPQAAHRWTGHAGAAEFYAGLLGAFPDIVFDLRNIVIGPQGVWEEAAVAATWTRPWLGAEPTGARLTFAVQIFFPWDRIAARFAGERVYVDDPGALFRTARASRTR